MAPTVEVLEGGDEGGAVGQWLGRLEAKRRLECFRCLRLGLLSLAFQFFRTGKRRALGGNDRLLFCQGR